MPRRRLRLTAAADARIEAALAELRRQLEVVVGFPDEVVAEADRAARDGGAPRRGRDGESRSSRSTHRSRWTSIRRSTSSAAGRATACGTRSPTSRRSSRPGACSTRRRAAASRRSTPPMETHACIRPHSPRGLRASYRASSARRSSGRWRWTRPAKGTAVHVRKARVRSRAKLSYGGAQRALDDGSADDVLVLLREVGILRQQREVRRGGVSLQLPEQEVAKGAHGYDLSYRAPFPVEGWNAQISLMTGMAAAELMVTGEVGILRTVPACRPGAARAVPAHGGGTRRPVAGGDALPRVRPGARRERPAAGCAARAGRRAPARLRLHVLRPAALPRTPSMPRSHPRTPTRPRRSGGSSTATSARRASRCRRTGGCPTGSRPRCRRCRS